MRLINDSKINLGHSPALQCLDRSHLNGFRPIGHSVVRLDYADVRQIGRASCRERVCQCVDLGGRRIIKKKTKQGHSVKRCVKRTSRYMETKITERKVIG